MEEELLSIYDLELYEEPDFDYIECECGEEYCVQQVKAADGKTEQIPEICPQCGRKEE